MSDGTYRGRWMDEICGSPHVSAEVKVLLLTMARWMDEAGHVSVPREQLAALLRCAPRNITAKQTAACGARLLKRTGRGHRGKTAEFQALVPGVEPPQRVTASVTQSGRKGDDGRHPNERKGDDDYHPLDGRKGDDDYHPFDSKGDDSHHPKAEKGGRQSSPQTYIHTQADDTDATIVVGLFDGETTSSSRSRTHKAPPGSDSPEFAAFWNAYPRKVAKGAARKAWDKAIKAGADPALIVLGARRYATDPRRSDSDIRYTAHPATWLNAERWADEDAPPPQPGTPAPTNSHALTGTDATVAGWLAAADRLQAQENQR